MFYLTMDPAYPVHSVTAGNCISDDSYVHPHRIMESYEIIAVRQGILHIISHGVRFDVGENEMLLIPAGREHMSACPSSGKLSFDWAHFMITDPAVQFSDKIQYPEAEKQHKERLILPEYGKLAQEKRTLLLFGQLLDIVKRNKYEPVWHCHYAMNLLLMEAAKEFAEMHHQGKSTMPGRLQDMMEWVHWHYNEPLTVHSLAERFHYHPTYLTELFRKNTGYSVTGYINFVRMTAAKNLLSSGNPLTLYEISGLCGFSDVKYFMRVFKKSEGVTPGQYQKAFRQKLINK